MRSVIHFLPYIQIVLSLIVILLVLIQQSDADLGGTFGGSDNVSATRTRRGLEKTVFNATIFFAVLFAASALLALFVR